MISNFSEIYITDLGGEYTCKNCIVLTFKKIHFSWFYWECVGNVAFILFFILHRCAHLAWF